MILWEPHGHKRSSQGVVGGDVVATILKHKNHTHSNRGIYSVIVLGVELPDRYREIGEARQAGEDAYLRATAV
jgi:hypothetical protein